MSVGTLSSQQQGSARQDQSNLDSAISETVAQMNQASALQMRMEHESIMVECKSRKRDIKEMLAELKEQADACPEFAKAAIYSKPVGTIYAVTCTCGKHYTVPAKWDNYKKDYKPQEDACPKCEQWQPKSMKRKQQKARNLSIRAAEAIAEVFGFNRTRADMTMLDATHWKIDASFFDYQKLRSLSLPRVVSKTYTIAKTKTVAVIPDDRFFGNVLNGELSKLLREVILRCVPPALKLALFSYCEKIAADTLDDEEITRIIARFQEKDVALDMIETYIGRTRREGWKQQDRLELLEMWNAIESGEATVAELFGNEEKAKPEPQTVPQSGATIEDLAQPSPPPDVSASEDALNEYNDLIQQADSLRAIDDLYDKARADTRLTVETVEKVHKICIAKCDQIRGTRGGRSNKREGLLP